MLTKFELVNTNGLKGLNYKGDFIPFDKIDDKLAEELEGKTHVLQRKAEATTAVAVVPADAAPEEAQTPKARRSA